MMGRTAVAEATTANGILTASDSEGVELVDMALPSGR